MASGGTTLAQSHRLPCTPQEVWSIGCQHGGTCFAWDSGGGQRSVGCSCTSEWMGTRCEYMYMEPDDFAVSYASQTMIAVAVVIPIIILIAIVTVVVFLCVKKKQRDREHLTFQKRSLSENHYESQNGQQLQRPTTLSAPNGQTPKLKYDSPDMSGSTQMSVLSDSQRYSGSTSNQTTPPTVFWESAV